MLAATRSCLRRTWQSFILLRPHANKHLAGYLETVWSLELAQLLFNLGSSHFTISVVQAAHEFPKVNGRIFHCLDRVSGGMKTPLCGKRTNGDIQKARPLEEVFERTWISEREHPGFSRRWRW